MHLIRHLLPALLLPLALPLMAQQADEARALLDRTAEAFRQMDGVEMHFTVRAPEGQSQGIIHLQDTKFYLEAGGTLTWFDGTTQWTYLTDADEVNISCPTAEELQALSPYSWLTLYRTGYNLKLSRQGTDADKTTYKVVMNAREKDAEIRCLIVYIDKATLRPQKVGLLNRGSKEAIVLVADSYKTGQHYSDAYFRFDPAAHPDAEIIDLR
ncbi:MAG: hypothetical protein LUB83_05205 [Prevotellaceae bacterium]|nr:hypothetical protein [Prevotellaceae bacterium]